jgi:release factor glutamine methyltransferase
MSGDRVAELLTDATARLRAAGVESPRKEARLLLAHALGANAQDLVAGNSPPLSAEALAHFEAFLSRRAAREPLAYIVGFREFWSLDFAVDPSVLVPRPESEILIEEALRRFPDSNAPLRVLDLGTGSGCLLLAFLSERVNATGLGVDLSNAALSTAAHNAKSLGLQHRCEFRRSDWTKDVSETFDAIFINPPYIPERELPGLEPEVTQYEPRSALDGGPDGLAAYRALAQIIRDRLNPRGYAFLEMGQGQAGPIGAIFAENRFTIEGTVYDLAGIPRCLVIGAPWEMIASKKQLALQTRSG